MSSHQTTTPLFTSKQPRPLYTNIAFTAEATLRQTTFLNWKGTALGQGTIGGLTVLARDEAGLIERIELYHRPLSIVLVFAKELERSLGKTLSARLFARLD